MEEISEEIPRISSNDVENKAGDEKMSNKNTNKKKLKGLIKRMKSLVTFIERHFDISDEEILTQLIRLKTFIKVLESRLGKKEKFKVID